jgi:hypothetical protein
MASLDRASASDDPLHVSVRDLHNGRWEVVCDRMQAPLINVESREAAFEFAMLLAVDHPPTTVEMAD